MVRVCVRARVCPHVCITSSVMDITAHVRGRCVFLNAAPLILSLEHLHKKDGRLESVQLIVQ